MTTEKTVIQTHREALITEMTLNLDVYLNDDIPTELTDAFSVVGESVLSQAQRLKNETPREAQMVNEGLSRCNTFLSTCKDPYQYLSDREGPSPLKPGLCNLGLIGILGEEMTQSEKKESKKMGEALLTFSVMGALSLPFALPNSEENSIFRGKDLNDYLPFTLNYIGVPVAVGEGMKSYLSNDTQVLYQTDKSLPGYTAKKAAKTTHTMKEQLNNLRDEANVLNATENTIDNSESATLTNASQ